MKLRVLFGVFGLSLGLSASAQTALIKKLDRYSSSLSTEKYSISAERKEQLSSIADLIISANAKQGFSTVLFADDNNSSVSQVSQALFQAAVAKLNVNNVNILSAGATESAIDKYAVSLLRNAGFDIESNTTFKKNPRYLVNFSNNENRLMMFSKTMKNFQIPSENLIIVNINNAAISASASSTQVPITYSAMSEDTFNQIAVEMMYLAEKIRSSRLLSHQQ